MKITFIRKYISSKLLEVGIEVPMGIEHIVLPRTEKVVSILNKKEINDEEFEIIQQSAMKLKAHFSGSNKCAFCPAPSQVTDRGIPLCDKHWEKACKGGLERS